MQYFSALKIGQKRVEQSRMYLNKATNGKAMPALAVINTNSNKWEPVGEKNFYAIITDYNGYVISTTNGLTIAICDENGMSKTIAQGINLEQKNNIIKIFKLDNVTEYNGKVTLHV